jgi:hypothetical protein
VVAARQRRVRHGSRAGCTPGSPVETALPASRHAPPPGAGACLAWNAHVLPRARLVDLAATAGREALDEPPFDGFAHRVDQAIQRDLLLAMAA